MAGWKARRLVPANLHRRGGPHGQRDGVLRGWRGARMPAVEGMAPGRRDGDAGGERDGNAGGAVRAGRGVRGEHGERAAAVLYRVRRRRAAHFGQQRPRSELLGAAERRGRA